MPLFDTVFGQLLRNLNQAFTTPSAPTYTNLKPTHALPTSSLSGQDLQVSSRRAIRRTDDMYEIQIESLLMTKLPIEVRSLIWDFVFSGYFGGRTMHLTFEENGRLTGFLCGNQFKDSCNSRAHGGTGFHDVSHWTGGEMPYHIDQEYTNLGWMGAIVSCRALYFETTKHIYSTLTFELSDSWTEVENLQWLIPFQHLRHMHKINLTILDITLATNDANCRAWAGIFTHFNAFPALTSLKIEIATKETCNAAAISSAALAKAEERLFRYMTALEGHGAKKKLWELILPEEERVRDQTQAENEIVRKGWTVSRIAKSGRFEGLLAKFWPAYD